MAQGQAILTLDGDGQHPVELIPEFINAWKNGAQVVIGLRTANDIGWVKRLTTRLFYKLFNKLADQKLIIGSTDFRLIDRKVQQVFLTLPEADRITRGLIDWLGFRREYIKFAAKKRESGLPGYNLNKLMGLAANSFTSLTLKPLFLFGYLGVLITVASFLLGIVVFIEQPLLGDPWHWKFTGTAMLGILILFLVGIVLMSQGIMSLYVSRIYRQSRISVYLFEMLVIILAQALGASAVLAVGLSFWLGLIVSFSLQKIVTFNDREMRHRILIPQLIAFSVLVLFNFGFTLLVTKMITPPVPAFMARTIALGITTIWNFYLYKRHIFRSLRLENKLWY